MPPPVCVPLDVDILGCAAGRLLLRMTPGGGCTTAALRNFALAMLPFGTALSPWVHARAAGNAGACAGQAGGRPGPAAAGPARCSWPQERPQGRHCAELQVPAAAGQVWGSGVVSGRGQI